MVSLGCNSEWAHAGVAQVPLLRPTPRPTFMASGVVALERAASPASAAARQSHCELAEPAPDPCWQEVSELSDVCVCLARHGALLLWLPAMAARSCLVGSTLEVEGGTHQGLQRPRSLQGWGEGSGRGCADAGVERVGQRPAAQHGAASQEVMLRAQGHDSQWCKLRRLIQLAAVNTCSKLSLELPSCSWRCRGDLLV